MTRNPEEPKAFYAESGLRFVCRRCSACCRLSPGFVFLSRTDIVRLLDKAALPWDEFKRRYLRTVRIGHFIRLSLREKNNYDCVFWEHGGCSVYEWRPLQCRSFPFWCHALASRESWREFATSCPGIGQGPVHSAQEINGWLDLRLGERLIELEDDDLEKVSEGDIRPNGGPADGNRAR